MYSYHYGIRFLGSFSTFLLADYSRVFGFFCLSRFSEYSIFVCGLKLVSSKGTACLHITYGRNNYSLSSMQPSLLLQSRICAFCCLVWHIVILTTPPIPSSYTHTERTSVVIAKTIIGAPGPPPPHPHTEPRLIENMLLPVCMFCMCRDALCCTVYLTRRIHKSYY